jgi:hypothetical protein
MCCRGFVREFLIANLQIGSRDFFFLLTQRPISGLIFPHCDQPIALRLELSTQFPFMADDEVDQDVFDSLEREASEFTKVCPYC